MKIFRQNKFSRVKHNFDYSTFDIPKSEEVKEILNELITPFVADFGLNNWNGNYRWFADFNKDGIKHVFEFARMKGISGTLLFGNCFYFIPTISNSKRLINHRTDKSTKLHLFDETYGYGNSFIDGKVSLHNKKEFTDSLIKLIKKFKPIIKAWYDNNKTIKENIETANYQLKTGNRYSTNWPSQDYILSFLYMKNGEQNIAEKQLDVFIKKHKDLLNEKIVEKLKTLIKTAANRVELR